MSGILVIRGGAIGDFVLTLPAIHLLREAFPQTRLEILGYRHIVALAEGRFYAEATRSIEYAGLASFFVPNGKLSPELADYFASFDQVVSYLYDPDAFFEENLRKAGVKNLITSSGRINATPGSPHAARQLAAPLERLALFMEPGEEAEAARLYPSEADLQAVPLPKQRGLRIAIHPGSGGAHKCWPLELWTSFLLSLEKQLSAEIVLIGGEADYERLAALQEAGGWPVYRDLPLPHLAGLLQRMDGFVGHDSGVSHIAAAVGTPSVLLFGPTDPAIWGPRARNDRPGRVHFVRAGSGDLREIQPETLLAQVSGTLIVD